MTGTFPESVTAVAQTGASVRYYHSDYRGSAVAFSDASGTVTGRVEYGPFGEIASRTGDTATPYLFNARYGVTTDPSGLFHMRARYYHPTIRRFVNQDTVIGGIANGPSLNQFAYANGNPISLIDPFGLAADSDVEGGGNFAELLLDFGEKSNDDAATALRNAILEAKGKLTTIDIFFRTPIDRMIVGESISGLKSRIAQNIEQLSTRLKLDLAFKGLALLIFCQ